MKHVTCFAAALMLFASAAIAQQPAGRKAGLPTVLQLGYEGIKADLIAEAEKMPESDYGPSQAGPTELVPTGVPQDPAAVGYLNLHKRHPDAAEGVVEFNTGYTAPGALQRLSQMEGFLASFARLTERVRSRVAEADLAAIGNTGSELQTIGFHNIPLIVEGTLLKQDYQLKQAEYALAQLKHARKEISAQELDRARRAYAEATRRFQVFWDKKLPTD